MKRPAPLTRRPPSAERVHAGPVFEVWQWEQPLFDGSQQRFEILTRRDTVLILPVTDERQVLLAHESQPGVRPRLHSIGGRVENGENPTEAAQRELAEEVGLRAGRFVAWAAWQPLSKIDWAVYLFWASRLSTEDRGVSDPGERISVESVPLQDLLSFHLVEQLDDVELTFRLGLAAMSASEHTQMSDTLAQALDGG